MTREAIETFSTVGVAVLCIVVGIATLTAFFRILSWFGDRGAKLETMAIRGVLKKGTWATVYMSGAETFERVRFVGFTSSESIKSHFPFELNGMVILEDPDGKRFLVRGKSIRMIVIESVSENGANKRS